MVRVEPELVSVGRDVVGTEHKVATAPPDQAARHHKVLFLALIAKEVPTSVPDGVVCHTITTGNPHHTARRVGTHVLCQADKERLDYITVAGISSAIADNKKVNINS